MPRGHRRFKLQTLGLQQNKMNRNHVVEYFSSQKLSSIDRAVFTCQELENSRVLKRVWRIVYLKEAKDPWVFFFKFDFSNLGQIVSLLARTLESRNFHRVS